MTYKTVVVDYSPKAKPMAAAIEVKANEMAKQDYTLVSMAITGSAKAILVFSTEKICDDVSENCAKDAPEEASGE